MDMKIVNQINLVPESVVVGQIFVIVHGLFPEAGPIYGGVHLIKWRFLKMAQ